MRFGFDIDDTLINLREHAFTIYNKKLGLDIPIEAFYELKRVEIHEPFGLTEEQGKAMWKDSLEEIYYTSCPPFPGAVETLNELNEQGHEIYYITARPSEHGERTKRWLLETGFPVKDDSFYYGMRDEEKIHIIRQLNLDYYVDDKPAVLDTLMQDSVKLLVKDQSYNKHLTMERIINWSDLKRIINLVN
ncbi:5' nucleotidase, NT5C type [Virgibacillus sp. DJP39]|uniref:5' nucleotidase, NT5C type n=1 Tax=Virgibacillus sp. DJP39 TaxID=3409790 RepID=UPI003BB5FDFB